ncbi:membrane protein [Lysinibacillus sp. BF-4]|uniref:DUF4870 domain-containing protein n=1 Tax=Lysinibacillus sp. BF-4 TaxID=1473546 RepID=UPI000504A845|nr:DUF4870 domain-containing protein [Lysinibacillus sp. BF-4]KFL43864.1 membrane protein [Lysinibacillus sp. BF-4]
MDNKLSKIIVHSSFYYAPFLVPVIMFFIATLVTNDEEVRRLSVQAVLFQIVLAVLLSVSWAFTFLIIGFPFLIIFGLIYICAPIIGIIRALQGETWNYPIVGRLV